MMYVNQIIMQYTLNLYSYVNYISIKLEEKLLSYYKQIYEHIFKILKWVSFFKKDSNIIELNKVNRLLLTKLNTLIIWSNNSIPWDLSKNFIPFKK